MTKLTDTQAILLATACQRTDGNLHPLHGSLRPGGGSAKAIAALVRNGFAEEREVTGQKPAYRTDGETRFGVFVTEAGMAAIGVEDDGQPSIKRPVQLPKIVDVRKAPSKIATVIALMSKPGGVPVSALIEATGWLPHTIRAAVTGLRKKGHHVQRIKRDGATCYRIASDAA